MENNAHLGPNRYKRRWNGVDDSGEVVYKGVQYCPSTSWCCPSLKLEELKLNPSNVVSMGNVPSVDLQGGEHLNPILESSDPFCCLVLVTRREQGPLVFNYSASSLSPIYSRSDVCLYVTAKIDPRSGHVLVRCLHLLPMCHCHYSCRL